MKKKILALAIGAAVTAFTVPAMSADVSVSGRAHMSIDQIDNGASGAAKDSGMDVASNSSRLRFSAKTEVVDGLTAMMQLEQTINFDRRTKEDVFTSRDSFFGLKGDFGLVRLGYFDTPTKKVRSFTDMFGDRIGDARNMTKGTFDQRFHNSVHYQTPEFNGLKLDAQYSANNNADDELDNETDATSVSLTYKNGPLTVMVAQESQGAGITGGVTNDRKEAIRLGATYNVMKGMRVAAFYEDANEASNDNTVMGLGAYYDLNADYRLRGQYYIAEESSAKNNGGSMMVVGIDRKLGKDLTLYAAYAATSNDEDAKFSVVGGGHGSSVTTVNGKDVSAISIGAIYNF